ncbi:hypothetical protein SEMRO_923_G220680.1 [Seminavis robusta]|uniref:Uncharacterized protein n=1 Tax=Seminavis robusta TaxID=568900 RepID=A0A9N8EGS8_9STRA|nr:hypothetical protein SEMRO_923_G220680.1 [Seminavis robusta]|eukprot:Sro923_g220680.1 n/a (134) ;mRNA; r:6161-6562
MTAVFDPQSNNDMTTHSNGSNSSMSATSTLTSSDGHSSTGIRRDTESGHRVGHLLGLLGYTQVKQGQVRMRVDKLYQSVATFLAWKHFNERDGKVLPWLPQALEKCDFHWTYQARDTMLNPKKAVIVLKWGIE